jgi:hypothetical protein
MKTAIEVYKLLPKTNCGLCGMPTCFGFATKVAAGLASAADCTNLSDTARATLLAEEKLRKKSPGTVYEQALESLKSKVQSLDFKKTAEIFGGKYQGPDALELVFLNEQFTVTKQRILDASGKEVLPWIAILIYNHLCMPDPPALCGEWITFSSVPASHAKDKAWAGHVEEVIAGRFSGERAGLAEACERLGGVRMDIPGTHDLAFTFRFFPRYPVLLLFFDAVPEESFPAQCRLLLDKNVPFYLDIESMVVLGEEFAGRLTG